MGKRVVIAEDEAIIRLDLKEILEAEGYSVVGETGRGDEAVELVARHEPDIAILDIKMPGIDGIEAARRISAEPPRGGPDPHRLQPAQPHRGGPRRRRRRLSGQAVPARRAGARPSPWPRHASRSTGPSRTSTPVCPRTCPPTRTSSRPARWWTGPRPSSWTATAWPRTWPSPSSSARPWTVGSGWSGWPRRSSTGRSTP